MTLARRSPAFREALAEARTLAAAWWDLLSRQATYDRRLNAGHVARMIALRARYNGDVDGEAPTVRPGTEANAGPAAPSVPDPEIRARIEAMLQAQVARKAWAR